MYVKIKLETFLEILYFLNWLMRHTSLGGAGDYNRLSRLIWKMFQEGVFKGIPEKEFPTIRGAIKNFQRIESIEKQKGK